MYAWLGTLYHKEKALEMPWKPNTSVRNSLIGSPSLAGQSSGSSPLINALLHPVQSVFAVEVEEMNDSGVESDVLHLLVGIFLFI